ncbi:MAG: hypothetical protein WB791_01495 [Waddliaceae bacterium]
MLRLEKTGKNRPIHVRMRESGRLVTPAFRQAFLLALGFHLLGFFFFHVSSLDVGDCGVIFPPVQVKIEFASEQEAMVIAQLETEKTRTEFGLAPQPSNPGFLPLPRADIQHEAAYSQEKHSRDVSVMPPADNFFPDPAVNLYFERHCSLLFPEKLRVQQKPAAIRVSGPLGERKIIDEGWRAKQRKSGGKKNLRQAFASFDIKVEDKTGKIIWYKKKQTVQEKTLRHEAENILRRLTFEQQERGLITSGNVEIAMTIFDEEACVD